MKKLFLLGTIVFIGCGDPFRVMSDRELKNTWKYYEKTAKKKEKKEQKQLEKEFFKVNGVKIIKK